MPGAPLPVGGAGVTFTRPSAAPGTPDDWNGENNSGDRPAPWRQGCASDRRSPVDLDQPEPGSTTSNKASLAGMRFPRQTYGNDLETSIGFASYPSGLVSGG
jgi:hypothetical protein